MGEGREEFDEVCTEIRKRLFGEKVCLKYKKCPPNVNPFKVKRKTLRVY